MFNKDFNPFMWEEDLKILDLSYFYLGIRHKYRIFEKFPSFLKVIIILIDSIFHPWNRDWSFTHCVFL